MEKIQQKAKFYTYKGYHIVRNKQKIFYGNMSEDYVTEIDVQSSHKVKDLDIADKLRIRLVPTDTENFDINKIKTTSRENLYEALEIARTWLGKANT